MFKKKWSQIFGLLLFFPGKILRIYLSWSLYHLRVFLFHLSSMIYGIWLGVKKGREKTWEMFLVVCVIGFWRKNHCSLFIPKGLQRIFPPKWARYSFFFVLAMDPWFLRLFCVRSAAQISSKLKQKELWLKPNKPVGPCRRFISSRSIGREKVDLFFFSINWTGLTSSSFKINHLWLSCYFFISLPRSLLLIVCAWNVDEQMALFCSSFWASNCLMICVNEKTS